MIGWMPPLPNCRQLVYPHPKIMMHDRQVSIYSNTSNVQYDIKRNALNSSGNMKSISYLSACHRAYLHIIRTGVSYESSVECLRVNTNMNSICMSYTYRLKYFSFLFLSKSFTNMRLVQLNLRSFYSQIKLGLG